MYRQPNLHFPIHDLDLDAMIFLLKPDLDMVKMYHHAKNEVSTSTYSKVTVEQTLRQTHKQYENITRPRTWEIKTKFLCQLLQTLKPK